MPPTFTLHTCSCLERNAQVRSADVSARLAAIRLICGDDLEERVRLGRIARLHDRRGEVRERLVAVDHAVVRRARVVLDLLQEDDVGRVQEVGDVVPDGGHVR